MSGEPAEVVAARLEVERARARLMGTARELQDRLNPGTLAQSAWAGAKSKGADIAEDAVDAVRKRPAIAGGVVAAIALFLARGPLVNLAGKLAKGGNTKRKSDAKPRTRKSRTRKATETTE